jgi:hypothetical protein
MPAATKERRAMDIRLDLESVEGVAIGVARGSMTLEDIGAAAVALWQRVEGPRAHILWDLREARFDLSAAEVQELAVFVKNESPPGDLRTAFVVSGDLEFGLVRMFEALRDAPNSRTRAFREMEPALIWLTGQAKSRGGPPRSA